ncbi:MAG TPA: MFS transporter [Methylomirabilota bacterium]|jgi:MFS family permease|nr:MFS transporter [Methylomirabilota bacterium]
MTFPPGLRALDHADFRRFWSGQLVSLIGTWMQSVAQSWLVLQLTDSPLRLGLIGTFQFAPILLFAVAAGAVADRLPKRRLILATQSALAAQAFTLAALVGTGTVRYWHVAILALLMGIANTLDMPARQSFIVEMVGKEDLVNAVALNSAAFNAARIVGPAAAGLLIAGAGIGPAFFLNGLSFLVVIVALLRTPTEGWPRPRQGTTLFEEMLEGLRYARRTPVTAVVLVLVLVVSLCAFNFSVLVPLLARDVLHEGPDGFGFLMAVLGLGAVIGALSLALFGSRPLGLAGIEATGAVACAATLALAGARHFWLAVPLLAIVGYASIVFMTSCNTTLQLTAPDELRGRVMSLYTFAFGGVFPLGSFLTGAIAEAFGVPAAFAAGGGAGLALVMAIVVWWRVR